MQSKELKRRCPVCKSNTGMDIHSINISLPEELPIPGRYDVVVCDKCGFAFADVDSSQEAYNSYYRDYNVYSACGRIRNDITIEVNEKRYEVFSKYIDKELKIADIGCGSGDWLLYLKKKGYENLYGIDPSVKSVEEIRTKGIEGAIGNIFDEAPENMAGIFDVICCTMVLEHIYDIRDAVRHLKEYVKEDGGMIFVDVPAV